MDNVIGTTELLGRFETAGINISEGLFRGWMRQKFIAKPSIYGNKLKWSQPEIDAAIRAIKAHNLMRVPAGLAIKLGDEVEA